MLPQAKVRQSPEGAVVSPMVGTVYLAAEPGAPAFVKPGDEVAEGDTLLIIEAMKVMNPLLAPRGRHHQKCARGGLAARGVSASPWSSSAEAPAAPSPAPPRPRPRRPRHVLAATPMFEKILIAGRGESALRILRSCRELGIQAVAAHSEADELAMHVRFADESVCIGPAPARESYLNQAAVISAALVTGADAIHPGIGFLSENPDFAERVRAHGLAFIGPSHEHIRTMGDKIAARRRAEELGLPVVPGSEGALADAAQAAELAASFGYPVLLKAAAGGGGRGMQIVEDPARLEAAWNLASGEAKSAFGDGRLYLEKFISNPRHIEVQILGDGKGNAVQSRRARLLHPTPQPEAPRRSPLAGADLRATPAHHKGLRRRHARDGLRHRRHLGVRL